MSEYPKLSEEGKQEAQRLIDHFKSAMKKASDEVISDLYVDAACWIESDSWTNFRNELMSGLKDYQGASQKYPHDYKRVREVMLRDYREHIIADINQDLLGEVERLKKQLEREREYNRSRNY